MIRARLHFGKTPHEKLLEWQRHQQRLTQMRGEFEKRQTQEAEDAADLDLVSLVSTVATTEEIAAFTVKLDAYDDRLAEYHEATIEALNEKHAKLDQTRRDLEQVQTGLESMREEAHELDDGTRIFLAEDGTWAIDIDGQDVAIEDISVETVNPRAWIAGKYKNYLELEGGLHDRETALEAEIDALHEFDQRRQELEVRSGAMRSSLEDGNVPSDDLKAYEKELEAGLDDLDNLMPKSVRDRIPGMKPLSETPGMKAAFDETAAPGAPLATMNPNPSQALAPAWQP